MSHENIQPPSEEKPQVTTEVRVYLVETLSAMEQVLLNHQGEYAQMDMLYDIFSLYLDQGGTLDTFKPEFIVLCEKLSLRTNFKAAFLEGLNLLAGTPKPNDR